MAETKRPWQGTALGVLDIIASVFVIISALMFLFLQDIVAKLFPFPGLQGFILVMVVVMIGFGILAIFMARGAFKGQKWSPILSIIFGILSLLSSVSNLVQGPQSLPPELAESLGSSVQASQSTGNVIFNIAIAAFMLYCSFVCVKDPFYSKK